MKTGESLTLVQRLANHQLSRRRAISSVGVGLAASALATTGFSTAARAQDSTPVATTGESTATPERVAAAAPELDALIADLLQRSGNPGLAVAAVYQDQVVHLKGYGVREVGKPELVDADTVFQIASVS